MYFYVKLCLWTEERFFHFHCIPWMQKQRILQAKQRTSQKSISKSKVTVGSFYITHLESQSSLMLVLNVTCSFYIQCMRYSVFNLLNLIINHTNHRLFAVTIVFFVAPAAFCLHVHTDQKTHHSQLSQSIFSIIS